MESALIGNDNLSPVEREVISNVYDFPKRGVRDEQSLIRKEHDLTAFNVVDGSRSHVEGKDDGSPPGGQRKEADPPFLLLVAFQTSESLEDSPWKEVE